MGSFIRFSALLVAFLVAGAGSAPAQGFLVGSLDCEANDILSSHATIEMSCVLLPFRGFPAFTGTLTRSAGPFPLPVGRRAAWGVYSLGSFPSLVGQYHKPQTGADKLVGTGANLPELRPLADVPGEVLGRNLAFGARRLRLRLQ